MKIDIKAGQVVKFVYTNYEGRTELRTVTVESVSYGNFPMHQGLVWVVNGHCHDRDARRTFDLAHIDMQTWKVVQK